MSVLRALVPLCALALACGAPEIDLSGPVAEWPAYGADSGGTRHSPLTQIDPSNVSHLEVAWTYRSGDVEDGSNGSLLRSSFQNTPILVDGTLYLCTPFNRVIALDPETGAERWSFDPKVDREGMYLLNCRGVSTWLDETAPPDAECRRRILTGTLDARLIALDAKTGRPCSGFGDGGAVDLRGGIGDVRPGEYGVTSAPTLIGDRIVTGAMVLDNRRVDMPGGVVRAFDARTGAEVWAWDPVPPGTPGPEAGARFRRGTTNAWTTFAADPELGLVFVPTGNTSADYFGGHRQGSDTYSSSVVALDADTGEVAWHFQTVHHDLWDYDLAAPPVLVTLEREGGPVDAVVQVTKQGFVFVLDRDTGESLFPIEERPVPRSDVPGEKSWPTQPFPTAPPPLVPQLLAEADLHAPTPDHRNACRKKLEKLRYEGLFTPPSERGSVVYPFAAGGANWSGATWDPTRQRLFVPVMNLVHVIRLDRVADRAKGDGRKVWPLHGASIRSLWWLLTGHGTGLRYRLHPLNGRKLLEHDGIPCNAPPWGMLVAVDLARGTIAWTASTSVDDDDPGGKSFGPALATASGLVFHGGTERPVLRAHDADTGERLATFDLPAGLHAGPITYKLRPDGRQFLLVAPGGHVGLGSPLGDYLIAYTLLVSPSGSGNGQGTN